MVSPEFGENAEIIAMAEWFNFYVKSIILNGILS